MEGLRQHLVNCMRYGQTLYVRLADSACDFVGAFTSEEHFPLAVFDRSTAASLVDRIAPEHLQLAVADPEALAAAVTHAGAIFLGTHTPEAIGDYVAGPNHVLPTSRSARFSSGLSVLDFLKRTTLLAVDREALHALAQPAMTLAAAEGLDAHRLSIARRLAR